MLQVRPHNRYSNFSIKERTKNNDRAKHKINDVTSKYDNNISFLNYKKMSQ